MSMKRERSGALWAVGVIGVLLAGLGLCGGGSGPKTGFTGKRSDFLTVATNLSWPQTSMIILTGLCGPIGQFRIMNYSQKISDWWHHARLGPRGPISSNIAMASWTLSRQDNKIRLNKVP